MKIVVSLQATGDDILDALDMLEQLPSGTICRETVIQPIIEALGKHVMLVFAPTPTDPPRRRLR